MLENTFLHLPGIGTKKERQLWSSGILTWDDYENAFPNQLSLFPSENSKLGQGLFDESRDALQRGDTDFFAERLPGHEHCRIALTFSEETLFLDIETTGLSHYYDYITMIGIGKHNGYKMYLRGGDKRKIKREISDAKCLVTFNGKIFDLKFIRKEFPDLRLPKAHIDLRFFARSVGLKGSQKIIEREIGIQRSDDIEGIIGEKAPLLWHEYMRGSQISGRKLVAYNFADIEGMKSILDEILVRRVQENPTPPEFSIQNRFSSKNISLKFASRRETVAKNRVYVPRYKGKRGPLVTYRNLAQNSAVNNLRVVGIDLTGSEKRASGWCLLENNKAYTTLLHSDAEIFSETEKTRPHIVSIDSPLSLPRGRKTVGDDDRGRDKYGIMRECERILKRRGVNVYPALIPSMQGLTARGIRLARRFRRAGLPVIESYPGAAQDIMGIPRKRAGLDYLINGLASFGIKGDFLRDKVSHDEADAITSAVVGLFFWAGKLEPLGNEAEDYLIIPDLHVSPEGWRQRRVIGISGPIAAGKTTAAKLIQENGFEYGRFSQVLGALLTKRGKEVNRDTLQKIGKRVHKKPGQRWLCREVVKGLPEDKDLVIDGLRFPEDHATLTEEFGPAFFHIHIEATEDIRHQRYLDLGQSSRAFIRAINDPVEQKVKILKPLADVVITNESTKKSLSIRLGRHII